MVYKSLNVSLCEPSLPLEVAEAFLNDEARLLLVLREVHLEYLDASHREDLCVGVCPDCIRLGRDKGFERGVLLDKLKDCWLPRAVRVLAEHKRLVTGCLRGLRLRLNHRLRACSTLSSRSSDTGCSKTLTDRLLLLTCNPDNHVNS